MKKLTDLCISAGVCLLIAAAAVMLWWQWSMEASVEKMESYVQIIRTQIPESQIAVLEERRDNTMSALSIDNTDFVGILEMPRYGLSLPVCGDWGKVSKYPCRLSGSVYDRSIQIGGTTQKGQYAFYRDISIGDSVCFTDMEGNQFTYAVTSIQWEKHADQEALHRNDADLTLFIKNIYAFEYIIVFCDALR